MLRNILELNGAQKLNKKEQKAIHGGVRSSGCGNRCGGGCRSNERCVKVFCGGGQTGSVCQVTIGHQ